MSYADDAVEAEQDILEDGEGTTATVRKATGATYSGGAIVPGAPVVVTGIPVVDLGVKLVPVEGGGLSRRHRFYLGAVKLTAQGLDPKQADEIIIGSTTYKPGPTSTINAIRPNPEGPAVLHILEVAG